MDPQTYAARRERLRPLLREAGLDALLVSLAANRFYLSGFELHDPQCNETAGYLLVTTAGNDTLLTDPRYLDAARRLFAEQDVFIYSGPRGETVRKFLTGRGLSAVGVESQALDVQTYLDLTGGGLDIRPTKGLVEKLRIIKEPAEVERMRRSCALNEHVFARAPELLVPGRTEAEVAWELEKLFRENGASELAFATIVGVGKNAALPHAIPGEAPVHDNELVLIDMGCRLGDYCSDQTRTFWVGAKAPARFREMLERVQGAQQAALKIIRPGLAFKDAYAAAHAHFESLGVADRFTHSLGHGIGLETHEPPSLSPRADGCLQAGMVVTVEPGLYYPEWGGARWEYMVLVTDDGAEIL